MPLSIPCVLMRAGTSRGPFFLRDWLPEGDEARNQALIGAIGASDPLQLDGLGGGSTLNSKVAIVSRSTRSDCDLDYLFAQVGVGHQSVDTRPNCGNMLSGVAPFAIDQGLITAQDGKTTVRIFNVNTGSQIEVTVCTPGGKVTYEGDARIDGVAGTSAPVLLNFLDAWGAVTGKLFPTGQRIDCIDGLEVTCIDAAMPIMVLRASDIGLTGRERPAELDANTGLLARIEALRLLAGQRMGLGDVSGSVIPKPVLVSAGDAPNSITSRYFTPHKCHASHAVTGAIGVATAFALPGTVASGAARPAGLHPLVVLHPAGQIDVEVVLQGEGEGASVQSAALVRTARKIMQGLLHLPGYVFPPSLKEGAGAPEAQTHRQFPQREVHVIVPTSAGGGNDTMARTLTRKLGPLLGQSVVVDNRAGANGSIACEYVAAAQPDGHTLMFGYIATHAINPALQKLRYDPMADFSPIGLIGYSPTLLVVPASLPVANVQELVRLIRESPGRLSYASAGEGTVPHFAAELFCLQTGVQLKRVDYSGAAPAIADVAGGLVHLMFPSLFTAQPYLRSGRLKALAVAGPARLVAMPETPTLTQAGVSGVEMTQWYALFAPAKTAPSVVRQLNTALNDVLKDPDIGARMEADGAQVQSSTPGQLHDLLMAEAERWQGVARQAGLRPDMSFD
ncbi:MAG: 4-oxalomesaconate tautomerase [Hydrogenophaga sp.]|uniref:4-oxalomesaconate tautomerase n=1 Tax=Hydrogenophaga sp. TaxID=1904254 RepID=UPI002722EA4B|nr:4-oxalomesaconate tautomerase [Hydrogenophaga sp.]MDO9482425.1 4-oxalomesaconate tautomerase [Hydrogenophaga sp.]MDO9569213.1 4-oxalomesaconate tautomerase [Hydrogenophaga sp.]MDP3349192.1 4-oxalomesaconate tautomerase [Hydrogenophaga sp.]MDP3372827.1 4-oxalomesaconate tautomerase [Hydrogenophaga sp.]MDP3805965.1 4-oxalomesaconate tautomerase [Hydrogenophaga sp.]